MTTPCMALPISPVVLLIVKSSYSTVSDVTFHTSDEEISDGTMRLDALGVPEEVLSGHLDAGSPRGTLSWTPLQYACALGDEELTRELLLEKKSNPIESGKTKYGYAPLHIAVHYGHAAIVDLLLAESAAEMVPVDAVVGASPLHLAVVHGNSAIVQKLIDATDRVSATQNGTTPYELAKRLGHVEIAQLLLNHEQKLRRRQTLGDWLASIGMMEYAEKLFAAGFDDAAFLLLNGLSDATMDAMKIDKPGHRIKLQSLYQLKEFLQRAEGKEEDNEEDEDEEEDDEEEEDSDDKEDDSEAPLEDDSSSGESGSEEDE